MVNVEDADVGPYLRLFTFRPREEIEELEKAVAERPHPRAAQRGLAEELTTLVHGAHQTEQVIAASQALFGRGDLRDLDGPNVDAALAEVPHASVAGRTPDDRRSARRHRPVESRGAARRTVAEGGAYVNNVKIADDQWVPEADDLLHGRWLVVRRGKRNIAGVRVDDGPVDQQ